MATYLVNISLSSSHGRIPHEMFYNEKIDVSNLQLFGADVMVFVPKEKRRKLDKNSMRMKFVGYDEHTKGYRCTDVSTRKTLVSRNVKFIQTDSNASVLPLLDEVREAAEPDDSEQPLPPETFEAKDEPKLDENPVEVIQVADASVGVTDETLANVTADDINDETFEPSNVSDPSASPRQTRSQAAKNRVFQLPWFANLAMLSDEHFALKCDDEYVLTDPENYASIAGRPDEAGWRKAMQEEIVSLQENDTWELVQLPKNSKAIKNKWVYKTKRNSDGDVVRLKARLVAKGFTQRYGIDYQETYAPVVRYTSVRLLIAMAASRNLKIHQLDAVTAYLQGDIDEDIYLEQPEGFNDGTGKVCKLKRAIYGLKQAGRQWNRKLDQVLKNIGLIQSKMDPCIYYNKDLTLMVAIYVDDFLLFYRTKIELERLIETLSSSFKMKDMGQAKGCIGIRIQQMVVNGKMTIYLDQEVYILEVLKRFGMADAKPIGNPCDINTKLSKAMVDDTGEIDVPYQQAVGCLLFLAQATRPDVAFAVHDVSRFNNSHCAAHWNAIKRIMRYLHATAKSKLVYTQNQEDLIGYCDADWAADVDSRKSVTGYVFKLAGGCISWKSTKQQSVALSSTEAEYIALASAIQESIWLRQLCDEIGLTVRGKPTRLYCDNQSAIKLALNGGYRPRSRHIDIRYHFLREHIERGNVTIFFIPTDENIADALTKAVDKKKLLFCNNKMGLRE